MPEIRRRVPDATLLIVGDGPYRDRLERLAADAPAGSVAFTGQVSEADLPRYYRAGNVFAMPCRNRLGGLEVEGWGNVFIEAAACGRPVVVGDSGGARESLVPGETGLLVNGSDVGQVAEAVASLLARSRTRGGDGPRRSRAGGGCVRVVPPRRGARRVVAPVRSTDGRGSRVRGPRRGYPASHDGRTPVSDPRRPTDSAGVDAPVMSSRALLWTSAGLVFLSVLIATFVTLPAARR